jgi:hypothetical protein
LVFNYMQREKKNSKKPPGPQTGVSRRAPPGGFLPLLWVIYGYSVYTIVQAKIPPQSVDPALFKNLNPSPSGGIFAITVGYI